MLDDGSDQTFMRETTAQMLKLTRKNGREVSVQVFDGNDIPTFTSDVEFEISNLNDDQRYKISAMTSKNVVGDYEAVNWNIQKENHKWCLFRRKRQRGRRCPVHGSRWVAW